MIRERFRRREGAEPGRIFRDRQEAGRELARALRRDWEAPPVVLALPRGGVPVAYEVAREIGAPLDVFLVRKIGAPGQPELGIGAVAQGGVRILNEPVIAMLNVSPEVLARITEEETAELERRSRRFRGDRPLPDLRGRTVIVVDDGLATGVSASAAIRALRRFEPAQLILAVPVCAPETVEALRPEADEIVCVQMPREFLAVGYWYREFNQTTDEEVVRLLDRARSEYKAESNHATIERPGPVGSGAAGI